MDDLNKIFEEIKKNIDDINSIDKNLNTIKYLFIIFIIIILIIFIIIIINYYY